MSVFSKLIWLFLQYTLLCGWLTWVIHLLRLLFGCFIIVLLNLKSFYSLIKFFTYHKKIKLANTNWFLIDHTVMHLLVIVLFCLNKPFSLNQALTLHPAYVSSFDWILASLNICYGPTWKHQSKIRIQFWFWFWL